VHHPLMADIVLVDEMHGQFSTWLEFKFLGVESEHPAWKFSAY